LTFHRGCPGTSKPRIRRNAGLEVTPEYLENTIRFLSQNNYEIVSMTRASQILKTGNKGVYSVSDFLDQLLVA
tara:strand:+ start:214 stop:432 length:219 start_codon:yes stop_codon:yes gene_type:complete